MMRAGGRGYSYFQPWMFVPILQYCQILQKWAMGLSGNEVQMCQFFPVFNFSDDKYT